MNERRQDFELLQRFTREGDQSAFTDVVRRHLDLVFGTALRKVEDSGAAQEVAQNVFSVLARKAWQFAPDDSLPAWLHKSALLESKSWLRGEIRRCRREETAGELGTTMNTPEDQPALNALVPLLDEALLSLREKDRTVLLLRFYECQSLRDVGAAFGVSEDTAQKRVQSALEKLSVFFERRGFRTATVAAAAAALQATAASVSAALAGTVARAALQAAPPALAGLGALIARLAGLTRTQTVAVCLALAAVPLAWQVNERRAAGEEARRMQAQLLATQNDGFTAQTEIERLRTVSASLEKSLGQANEAAARAAASAQAFEVWKKKIRGQLMAADYRWPDDSPFVRIPKSAVPELNRMSVWDPFDNLGRVLPFARELMGMTPTERQSAEETLHRHFADVEARQTARMIETDRPLSGRAVANRVFVIREVGDEAKLRTDQTLAEIRDVLGEERWRLVQARLEKVTCKTCFDLNRTLNQLPEELRIRLETDDRGIPTVFYEVCEPDGEVTTRENLALSMFLPDGDPNRTQDAVEVGFGIRSNALSQRVLAWLREQAVVRLGKKARQ